MKRSSWHASLAIIIALLGCRTAAASCETSRDRAGTYFTTCIYRVEGKPPTRDLEVKFAGSVVRFSPELPDLVLDKYKYGFNNRAVDVYVDVRNDGRVSSAATAVAVTIELWDPTRATQYGNDIEVVAALPVIAPGDTPRIYVATVTLPNLIDDFDVVSTAFVDPAVSAQATYGRVFESNEMNNAKGHACRIFGTDPVLIPTPPPVCN